MAHLRWEAWPFPGAAPYGVQVRDLQAVSGNGTLPKIPCGQGSVSIPRGVVRSDGSLVLDAVAASDPADPSNDVTSLIRVYRPGEDDPVHEWLVENPVTESDDSDLVTLSGRNIEAVLDYEHVEVWDWDGSDVFQSTFPDHIYGGKNLLGDGTFDDQDTVTERYELWNDQTAASTFQLTMEGVTTAAIAFDATANQVEAAIEATAGITDCLVTGSGTEADPWVIEFIDPGIIAPDMSVTDAGGLTSTLTQTQEGHLSISPYTVAQTLAQGVNTTHGVHASDSPKIVDDVAPPTGTYSLWFNGLTAPYTGVQRVVNVKPGGTYQASVRVYNGFNADLYRLVIRTLNEDFIASSTPFSGTNIANNTWDTLSAADVVIPDGVTQVIMRVAYVGTGNPDPIRTWGWELNEGLSAATPGSILVDLFDDAQTDHAPTRAALTFLNLTFDALTDSNGTFWDVSDLSITIKRGQTYLQMMRQFEKLGYEWDVTPTAGTPGEWDLNVYNPNGLGTDHGGADDPAVIVGQGTLPSNVTRQPPTANYLMAEGKDGLTSRVANAASIGAVGRRTQALADRRYTQTDELTAWVTQRLSSFLAETLAPRVTLTEPNADGIWPRPLGDYRHADVVDFVLADGATRVERRVEQVSYNDTGDLVWTVEGGSAVPYVAAPSVSGGPAAYSPGHLALGSQIRVLGDTVSTILQEFRFQEDLSDAAAYASPPAGSGGLPAFTVRVAAVGARTETKAAADFICTGADDGAQIVAALAICDALGFGRVVLSEGQFSISNGTTFTVVDGVQLVGMGEDVTVCRLLDGNAATLDNSGIVRDITFDETGGT